jgi:hypothetical protein
MTVVDQEGKPPSLLFSHKTSIPFAKPGTLELTILSIDGTNDCSN